MHVRLTSFLSKNCVLHNSQHGFIKKHSTTTAVAEFLDHITLSVDKRKRVLGLFIDISKAFDAINHDVLLKKLRFQYVEHTCGKSGLRLITSGVPQGSILGTSVILNLCE
jgi:hypothetical protein